MSPRAGPAPGAILLGSPASPEPFSVQGRDTERLDLTGGLGLAGVADLLDSVSEGRQASLTGGAGPRARRRTISSAAVTYQEHFRGESVDPLLRQEWQELLSAGCRRRPVVQLREPGVGSRA